VTDQDLKDKLAELISKYGHLEGSDLLSAMAEEFNGNVAISTSFGAESACLLSVVREVSQDLPVLFMDTGHIFEETLTYMEQLTDYFGLRDVRVLKPNPIHIEAADRDATLWERDHDYCCHLRKVLPFEEALEGFEVWASGRKRFQSSERSSLNPIELDGNNHFKVNPLYNWTYDQVRSFIKERNLPEHPLFSRGFVSIGCKTCTRAISEGEDLRAGRWPGRSKTECGIHKPAQ
jgi:phosphoadenosine phosphosulfate reductase